ncbi:lactate utilization protein C [Aquibacillus halophilus]|uniref:Lactate utilization protein C n=1 Tax=Aquibacillus halophilus TaxID=930132 RepID=A0A6A8DGX7_9BACI|nr:lactate utilization protein C [Aquibacillus halophilus]MRH43756.1 lactate utilization protein C [Aquibacillus halophilus]
MAKGEIKNRESFLDTIANNLARPRKTSGVERPKWSNQVQWNVLANYTQDELLDVLEKQCDSIHTDLVRTSENDLSQALRNVIEGFGGKSVMTWDDSRFNSFGLADSFRAWKQDGIDVHKWDASNGDQSIQLAEQADVGITFSDITLAESGTVVLFSDQGKGRSVSLLPATYIAIIPKSTIVPRMTQATREIHQRVENGERIASCVNFISGPSNSADIEMNLVVGVHGPIKATYIVVEDC